KAHLRSALAWPYPSDSYKATPVFPDNTHWSVRAALPLFLSLSLLLIGASLNTFWSTQLLVFCFTIVVGSYSNSYELVGVIY
ncbi:unnamed protein product, partial [Hymenolepis diminuta]